MPRLVTDHTDSGAERSYSSRGESHPSPPRAGQVSDESPLSVYNSGAKVGYQSSQDRVGIRFCIPMERGPCQARSKHL